MSGFKEQLGKDLDQVWFSEAEEFWETHLIGGQFMRAIIDSDELRRRSARRVYAQRDGSADSGIYAARKLLMVRAAEFGSRPVIGSRLQLDRAYYRVSDIDAQAGLYLIELEALRS